MGTQKRRGRETPGLVAHARKTGIYINRHAAAFWRNWKAKRYAGFDCFNEIRRTFFAICVFRPVGRNLSYRAMAGYQRHNFSGGRLSQ